MGAQVRNLYEVTADKKQEVEAFIRFWMDEITHNDPDRPTALYAEDGMLWPTFSETLRTTREGIRDYFAFFTALPNLKAELNQLEIRKVVESYCTSGVYTFTHTDSKGELRTIPARFTFTLRPNPKAPQGWEILNHHSSTIPGPPPPL